MEIITTHSFNPGTKIIGIVIFLEKKKKNNEKRRRKRRREERTVKI